MPQSPFLQAAIQAVQAGAEVIKHYYKRNLDIQIKTDRTPLTIADIETEQAIKTILKETFPEHGFYGEETGKDRLEAEYIWLVDPIDGTKSFIRGYPFFSTQIALMKGGEFILGVSHAPIFGELAYAEVGGSAFLNDQAIRVSSIGELADATLSLGNIKTLASEERRWKALAELVCQVNRTRGYGDFYHYHLLAAGKIDLVIESDIHILDVAALSVIVRAAGGQVTDLEGKLLSLDTTTVVAGNRVLHEPVMKLLA